MKNKIRYENDYAVLEVIRKGKVIDVLIDIEDIELVSSIGSWHAICDETLKTPAYYIAHRYDNKTKGKGVIKLHRLVTNCPRNKVIDHINHNTCDNRKANLRICTLFENQQNLRSRSSSHTGVHKRTRYGRTFWVASITKNKKRLTKDFKTEQDAVAWRVQKEKELYSELFQ